MGHTGMTGKTEKTGRTRNKKEITFNIGRRHKKRKIFNLKIKSFLRKLHLNNKVFRQRPHFYVEVK